MTAQQPQRLSAEREAYLRQEADDCSSTASSWLPELFAELDAVRAERDRCIATRKEEIKYLVPTQQTESLHADLATANERVRALETALRRTLDALLKEPGEGVTHIDAGEIRALLAQAPALSAGVQKQIDFWSRPGYGDVRATPSEPSACPRGGAMRSAVRSISNPKFRRFMFRGHAPDTGFAGGQVGSAARTSCTITCARPAHIASAAIVLRLLV